MSESSARHDGIDLSFVTDPDVRRALRAMHQQMTEALARQQLEIDAILEALMERHLTSLGEFRRHLTRLQADGTRAQRLHGALDAQPHPPAQHGPQPAGPQPGPQHR